MIRMNVSHILPQSAGNITKIAIEKCLSNCGLVKYYIQKGELTNMPGCNNKSDV